jgi:threonine-phosphate decarboxylase
MITDIQHPATDHRPPATDHRPPAHGSIDYVELQQAGIAPADVLDFSSNLNPAGTPPAIRSLLAGYDPAPYPDRHCLALRLAIAAGHGCDPDQALAGNGSNELIHLIARAWLRPGDRALVIGPTFGEYAQASRLAGASVSEWTARQAEGFAIDGAACARLIERERPRLVWLCNPNNPTGTLLGRAEVAELEAACAASGGLLVIDHAYAELLRDSTDPSIKAPLHRNGEGWPRSGRGEADRDAGPPDCTPRSPHALHLHSLTKSHALAGLRLGYLLGERSLIARISAYQPSWSVNGLAQAAGVAALADRDFLAASLPQWWRWSDDLRAGLIAAGATILPSQLPFFLAETTAAAPLRAALLRRGCLVRDCSSFGLDRLVRIAPRVPRDNARLVAAWGQR